MAQVTFIDDAGTSNTTGTTTTVNKPAGTQDGDILITAVGTNSSGLSITTLAGWNLLDSEADIESGKTNVYWKLASSEGADYTWTHTSLAGVVIHFHVSTWRNVHATAGLAIYSSVQDGSSDTTATVTGVTPTTAPHGVLLGIVGFVDNPGSVADYAVANNNPTWTEIHDASAVSGGNEYTLAVAYGNYDFAADTGDFTATITAEEGNREANVFLIFLRPAGFSFAPPVMTVAGALIAPAVAAAIAIPAMTMTGTMYAPTITEGDPEIVNVDKNSASMTNTSKNSASFTNTSKNSSSWTNQSKS